MPAAPPPPLQLAAAAGVPNNFFGPGAAANLFGPAKSQHILALETEVSLLRSQANALAVQCSAFEERQRVAAARLATVEQTQPDSTPRLAAAELTLQGMKEELAAMRSNINVATADREVLRRNKASKTEVAKLESQANAIAAANTSLAALQASHNSLAASTASSFRRRPYTAQLKDLADKVRDLSNQVDAHITAYTQQLVGISDTDKAVATSTAEIQTLKASFSELEQAAGDVGPTAKAAFDMASTGTETNADEGSAPSGPSGKRAAPTSLKRINSRSRVDIANPSANRYVGTVTHAATEVTDLSTGKAAVATRLSALSKIPATLSGDDLRRQFDLQALSNEAFTAIKQYNQQDINSVVSELRQNLQVPPDLEVWEEDLEMTETTEAVFPLVPLSSSLTRKERGNVFLQLKDRNRESSKSNGKFVCIAGRSNWKFNKIGNTAHRSPGCIAISCDCEDCTRTHCLLVVRTQTIAQSSDAIAADIYNAADQGDVLLDL